MILDTVLLFCTIVGVGFLFVAFAGGKDSAPWMFKTRQSEFLWGTVLGIIFLVISLALLLEQLPKWQ